MAADSKPLFDRLAQVAKGWPGQPWSWDGRFQAASGAFPSTVEKAALACAALALPKSWSGETLAKAPAPLQELCDGTGGLREGQLLLGGDALGGLQPFGLWWPWGGGKTITLRIGLVALDGSEAPLAQLKAAFGLK